MQQYQITSRPRHLRYIFFVDVEYSYDQWFELICLNQGLWGGRYNPIIPVTENTIFEQYHELLKHYDPDYIFYSEGVDPDVIRRLRLFNPQGYYKLEEQRLAWDIIGVNVFYLLSQLDPKSKIVLSSDLWKTGSPLLDFYKLNFGLGSSGTVSDYEIGKKDHR